MREVIETISDLVSGAFVWAVIGLVSLVIAIVVLTFAIGAVDE